MLRDVVRLISMHFQVFWIYSENVAWKLNKDDDNGQGSENCVDHRVLRSDLYFLFCKYGGFELVNVLIDWGFKVTG